MGADLARRRRKDVRGVDERLVGREHGVVAVRVVRRQDRLVDSRVVARRAAVGPGCPGPV